ncbi:Sir2 silent information regulator family NAD-dependent deacetylase [Ruminococcus sp. CLA-AA-H200]|uniref:Sir2 silent information regulator family NAD-dependent deacetylase n=1 Tax=Ruminococcus turbiniformis TaxID=2881258 RepID=A0ABS8FUC3_9FIRM|nr:Sir2 silent information regulator family NAD-dependent deacetylase [Ruminococcus turbiniformis]MCC2253653.1 Sir2 silent information regulator family NAD-dependent deacetylase [Ruminococcus turbiniformis]
MFAGKFAGIHSMRKNGGYTGKDREGKENKSPAERLRKALDKAETVVIGAGAGLSTSAGFVYTGERFDRYFSDFAEKYGFSDMYSGGFYPFATLEEFWAYWSRYIWINRCQNAPKPVYDRLYDLVKDKDYFVLTTNVDHCFQKAGFDRERLFYTQGDYGLLQCSEPCTQETYDNEKIIRKMVESQGFLIGEDGTLTLPSGRKPRMCVPSELVPHCPHCGKPLTTNLRADSTFVEDAGWHRASERYAEFMESRKGGKIVFLELGVGYNTPVIIKYPFWQMTYQNPEAVYVCVNYGDAAAPQEIAERAVCIDGDIGELLKNTVECMEIQ